MCASGSSLLAGQLEVYWFVRHPRSPGYIAHGYIAQWLERLTADQQDSGCALIFRLCLASLENKTIPQQVSSKPAFIVRLCGKQKTTLTFLAMPKASPQRCSGARARLLSSHREKKVPRGFELQSSESESRVLTVTPRDQLIRGLEKLPPQKSTPILFSPDTFHFTPSTHGARARSVLPSCEKSGSRSQKFCSELEL